MEINEFRKSLSDDGPPAGLTDGLAALWWHARGDWNRAHSLAEELESKEGMPVRAHLHRKEGALENAEYWYARAGRIFRRASLEEEREPLLVGLADDLTI